MARVAVGIALLGGASVLTARFLPYWYNTWLFHRMLADHPAVPEVAVEAVLGDVTRFIHVHERCAVIVSTERCPPCRWLEEHLARLDETRLIPLYRLRVPGVRYYEHLRAAGVVFPTRMVVPTVSVFERGRMVRTYTGWGDGCMSSPGFPERINRILTD